MSRPVQLLLAPESLLLVLGAVVFIFCARHSTYSNDDVAWLTRAMWLLPLIAALVGYVTAWPPENRTWGWLMRINLAISACVSVCGLRIVSLFGAPGSGPKGQDAGFIVIIAMAGILMGLGNTILASFVLRNQRPTVDSWFQDHPFTGVLAVAAAAIPMVVLQLFAISLFGGLVLLLVSLVKR